METIYLGIVLLPKRHKGVNYNTSNYKVISPPWLCVVNILLKYSLTWWESVLTTSEWTLRNNKIWVHLYLRVWQDFRGISFQESKLLHQIQWFLKAYTPKILLVSMGLLNLDLIVLSQANIATLWKYLESKNWLPVWYIWIITKGKWHSAEIFAMGKSHPDKKQHENQALIRTPCLLSIPKRRASSVLNCNHFL